MITFFTKSKAWGRCTKWLSLVVGLLAAGTSAAMAQTPAWQLALSGNNNQPTSGYSFAHATAVDAVGDVIVVGTFLNEVTFGNARLVSAGGYDTFVAKWSTSSNSWAWATRGGGTGGDGCNGVAVNGSDIFVTGFFTSGTNAVVANTALAGAGAEDLFLAKYTSTGTGVWATSGGGTTQDEGRDVAVSGSNVYVTGYFSGPSATIANAPLSGAGDRDLFLAKYTDGGSSATGNWATCSGGTGEDQSYAVEVSGSNLYLTGFFTSNSNARIAGTVLPGAGGRDLFVAKYTDAGSGATPGWAISGGGTDSDQGSDLAVNNNQLYVTGFFGSATGARIAGTLLTGEGSGDVFIAKYLDLGTTASNGWVTSVGGTGQDVGISIKVSNSDLYLTGSYQSSVGFTIAGTTLTSTGTGAAAFVAKYTDTGTGPVGAWATRCTNAGYLIGNSIAVRGNHVYVAVDNLQPIDGGTATFDAAPDLLAPPLSAILGQLNASTGVWQQVAHPLQGGTSQSSATATNAAGDVFVTGIFTGTVGFGNTVLTSAGSTDLFVAKWEAVTGTWAWAVRGGGSGSDGGSGIAVSGSNVYVTGNFSNSSARIAGLSLSSAGNIDMFLAKYIDQGNSVSNGWVAQGGGPDFDKGNGIAVSGTNIYVTGYLGKAGASIAGTSLTSAGAGDVFVAKYTDAGTSFSNGWATSGGGFYDEYGTGIAVSGSNVYVTGTFISKTASIAGTTLTGVGTNSSLTATNGDVFVAKYIDQGNAVSNGWATSAGGSDYETGGGIAVSGSNVYVTGSFSSATGAVVAGTVLTGAGTSDMFVAKYTDLGGSFANRWATSGGGSTTDWGQGIAVNGTNVYVTGTFSSSTASFSGTTVTRVGSSFYDLFVARYTDLGGTFANGWALSGGGSAGTDNGFGLAVSGRNVYVVGNVVPAATFGGITLSSPTGSDTNFLGQILDSLLPILTGISPSSGLVGSSIVLNGTGLTGASTIAFAGGIVTSGFMVNASGTQITGVAVPLGATTGPVTVTTPGGISNGLQFTVTVPLAITTLSPATNLVNAPRTSPVRVTFNQTLTGGSGEALKVFSNQQGGLRTSGTTPAVVSGTALTYTPAKPFMPGETVSNTVTTAATSAGGPLSQGKVVQFTAAVGGTGRGYFNGGAEILGIDASDGVMGDVDGDGDLDLLTTSIDGNYNGIVTVRRNNGNGGYATSSSLNMGFGYLNDIMLGDVDGDGDLDLVTGGSQNISMMVRLNDGTGTFVGGSDPVLGYCRSLALADVDADGDLDILMGNGFDNNPPRVSIALNYGNGTFNTTRGSVGLVFVSDRPLTIAVGDVDGDSDLDFVSANSGGPVSVRLNNGDGTFAAAPDLALTNGAGALALGDLDSDGDLDLAVAYTTYTPSTSTSMARVYSNNGSGQLVIGQDFLLAASSIKVALGDVDADGDLDLLSASSGNQVSIRLNSGTGHFTGGSDAYVENSPKDMEVGDVDGDGDLDVVTINTFPYGTNTGANSMASIRLNQLYPVLASINPPDGTVGTSVTLTGTNLTGAASVSFNGTTQTAITANTATGLTVIVPVGATSGPVTITTPIGTSNGLLFTVTASRLLTWTGAVNTDWNVAGNWSGYQVPGAADDALIPDGPALQPIVTGAQTVRHLSINSGATVTLANASAAVLSLRGNLTNNGALVNTGPTGALLFEGSALQTISGTSTTTVSTLQVGAGAVGVALNSPVQVSRLLEVSQNLTSNGHLTLLSDRTGTALVHNVGPGVVLGTATVQRAVAPNAFAAGAAYRHFSSPVAATTIADFATPGFTPVVNSLYNTDPDPSRVQPFPTVLGYEQTRLATVARNTYGPFDKGWFSPAALTDRLAVGRGYSLHINAAQTVDFVGTLNTGNYTLNLARNSGPTANEAGWALVGNPYPSPLDWTLVTPADRPGLDAALYVNEPTGPYSGRYSTNANGVGDNPRVASGQAFFVRVSQGQTAGQLTFRNSQRGTTPGDEHPFQRGTGETRPLVQLALQGTSGPADNLYLYAQAGATAAQDAGYDAVKLDNSNGLNLASILKSGEALAIDGRPELASAAIPLRVGVPASGTYTLRLMQALNLPLGTTLLLTDALTGQQTDLRQQTSYSFTVAAGAPANGRFWLNLTAGALATASSPVLSTLSVFPNPAHEQFTVLVPAVAGTATVQAELLNALGQVVRRESTNLTATGARFVVDATNLAVGIYSLRVQAGSTSVVKRVVIQEHFLSVTADR